MPKKVTNPITGNQINVGGAVYNKLVASGKLPCKKSPCKKSPMSLKDTLKRDSKCKKGAQIKFRMDDDIPLKDKYPLKKHTIYHDGADWILAQKRRDEANYAKMAAKYAAADRANREAREAWETDPRNPRVKARMSRLAGDS